MLLFLVICILLVLIYVAQKLTVLAEGQASAVAYLERELPGIKATQNTPLVSFAHGWYDDGWPFTKSDEEERAPLENPTPHRYADDYSTQMYISEYKSIPSGDRRKEFLRQLFGRGVCFNAKLLDTVYADESAFVRAWAAAPRHRCL